MANHFTGPLTVNGAANLLTLLKAAGYIGPGISAGDTTLYNASGSVTLYLHFTDSGSAAPGTGTNGLPIGGASSPASTFTIPKGSDLSTTWLYTASSISVVAGVC